MTELDATESATPSAADPTAEVWATRIRTRTYLGHNSRGAEVAIGPAEQEGVFTPGELLKLALVGCIGLTADAPTAHRLGDDFDATVRVRAIKDQDEDRYPTFDESFELELGNLSDDERARLIAVVERAIDRACTISRTLKAGAQTNLTVTDR